MQYYLEFIVAGLGLVLLLWEAFATPKKKATLAIAGAAGLTVVLLALVGTSCSSCTSEAPQWMARFVKNDSYALFFKGFALVSTILVLLMSFDFQKIINKFTSPDGSDTNAGEFYCLPVFACAGLMWMASATDLVSIFVALELVTITFYVMVAFMRRNVGSLEGAPTPITAFLSVASKAAGFGVAITILRPFLSSPETQGSVATILVIMAAGTLLYGNLAALSQTNFKRLLAYSSIAHAGFLLLGLATGAFDSVLFYLATYLIMTFAAFFILALIRSEEDSEEISALNGLGKRNPLLAGALTVIMASMAGVPLTAGFVGKFKIFEAALTNLDKVSWLVIVIAFIGAAAGFYYYFKIIRAIYWNTNENESAISVPLITKVSVIVLTVALLVFGVFPKPIFDLMS